MKKSNLSHFLVIPAVDIRRGKVVRLERGDYAKEKPYQLTPCESARQWASQGAERIHIVDLDGAREGKVKNLTTLKEILSAISIPVEFGGGIRDLETISLLLEQGVNEVVLGTRAITDVDFLKKALQKFPKRIIVSVDASEGEVKVAGWREGTGKDALGLVKSLESAGVGKIIYTDISRDGVLEGPNLRKIEEVLKTTDIPMIASGGISSLDDIKRLKMFKDLGLFGVIIGKALYEDKIDLQEAIKIAA